MYAIYNSISHNVNVHMYIIFLIVVNVEIHLLL